MSVYNAHAVVLGSKVYIGGGILYPGSSSRLLIYDITEDSWGILNTPSKWYTLTTYRSQLVLVGGADPDTSKAVDQLWVLDEQCCWTQPLSPMITKRYQACAVSVGDCLIVAGGFGGSHACPLDAVEVYNGSGWRRVQSLPMKSSRMKSAFLEGDWYLASGMGQHPKIYYTSVKSLIATYEGTEQTSVWKKLPCKPLEWSTLAVFSNKLITVGGGYSYNSAIHAYSSSNDLWVHVGDVPVACCSPCTVVLPTGELLVGGGDTASDVSSSSFKASIRGDLIYSYSDIQIPQKLGCIIICIHACTLYTFELP